ncbi:hypothetical protein B23_3181 [Geobacillus thermoleovorans B23]|nr:hypothetical protein B23_3181 [Geobacillus thermoleovorans B23]
MFGDSGCWMEPSFWSVHENRGEEGRHEGISKRREA